ncbi:ATP-dependent protease La [Flagelloscypha sp. PMI_526]|nr:ATP-dependent protease La [Flagelloscypha sp. PMI_526]
MSTMASRPPMSTRLPVLPLYHPTLLLPGGRLNLSLPREQTDQVLKLFQDNSETLPIVAAVPIPEPADSQPIEWGCAARILRIVRPVARGSQYIVSIQGLTRIKLDKPLSTPTFGDDAPFQSVQVAYPSEETALPHRDVVSAFRSSSLRFLSRLQLQQSQGLAGMDNTPSRTSRAAFSKIATMIEDVADDRAAWVADLLIGAVPSIEWNDKLALLSTTTATDRLTLTTQILQKLTAIAEVASNVASRVDESLSKQQKEYFLRQQLSAIQRELKSLHSDGKPRSDSEQPTSSDDLDLDNTDDADEQDLAALKAAIEKMLPGTEERKMGAREYRRLKRIPSGSVENGVIRSYLEWLTSLPWPTSDPTPIAEKLLHAKPFLARAREQLDADHFGLEKIKRRLVEFLAVERLREKELENLGTAVSGEKSLVPYKSQPTLPAPGKTSPRQGRIKAPILLFCGPPGVGKTSLGQSVARVLGRPFQRISLGGVRDEAEIRGHRRTYVASGPGLIVQALRKMGTSRGVLLLDEIDKVGQSNHHGDPSAALLEVLDPEQNYSFNDHYLNVPVDLSQMLFICTANSLDTISGPLLDRCELIQLSGYTHDEKLHIARRFLLPKQLGSHGLSEEQVHITEEALKEIATEYTREAGVRSLERTVGSVVRYKAVQWAEFIDDEDSVSTTPSSSNELALEEKVYSTTENGDFLLGTKTYSPRVEVPHLEEILGLPRWDENERERETRRGLVYGLVVMGQGEGGVLPVETVSVPGKGGVRLTGSLGEVIKESAELALSWVKRHAYDLRITDSPAQDPLRFPDEIDVHLHLPAGAQRKDGPSAGVAMTCAFVSLLTGACVPSDVAMTGEITLRGRVTPVGGVKEKVLGAHRAGLTKVILPYANRKDVEQDVAPDVRAQMELVFVRTIREALDAAFGKNALSWRKGPLLLESRL